MNVRFEIRVETGRKAVVCEDIERSARDTFNALKLEKEMSREGIPLFATDEPATIKGISATTVLVRRVKQGVAEWFRLQLKGKAWKGLLAAQPGQQPGELGRLRQALGVREV